MTVTSCVIAANKIFVFIELVFLINEYFELKHILSYMLIGSFYNNNSYRSKLVAHFLFKKLSFPKSKKYNENSGIVLHFIKSF